MGNFCRVKNLKPPLRNPHITSKHTCGCVVYREQYLHKLISQLLRRRHPPHTDLKADLKKGESENLCEKILRKNRIFLTF